MWSRHEPSPDARAGYGAGGARLRRRRRNESGLGPGREDVGSGPRRVGAEERRSEGIDFVTIFVTGDSQMQRSRKGYCGWCGQRILPKSRGRRARYCCHAHRQRAYEDRRRRRTEGSWRSLLHKDLRQAAERRLVERVAQRVLVLLEERPPSLPPAPPPPRPRLHVVRRPPSPPKVG
jgi:hypothetical protein